MALPDIGKLRINGVPPSSRPPGALIPQDIADTNGNREMEKLKNLARLLPYSIEPNSRMQQMLDFIIRRICQAVEAQDYDVGFLQWDTMLTLFATPVLLPWRIMLMAYFQLGVAQVPGFQGETNQARKIVL